MSRPSSCLDGLGSVEAHIGHRVTGQLHDLKAQFGPKLKSAWSSATSRNKDPQVRGQHHGELIGELARN